MPHELDKLLGLYDRGGISRRALIEVLAALTTGLRELGQGAGGAAESSLVRARTLNHATIMTADVARSKAFYQRLTGLRVRDEGKDFCELRLTNGLLGLYAPDAG